MRWNVPPTHGAEGPLAVQPSPYGEALRRVPSYPDPARPYDTYGRPSMWPGPVGPAIVAGGLPVLTPLARLPGYRGEVDWRKLSGPFPKPHPADEYAPPPTITYEDILKVRRRANGGKG